MTKADLAELLCRQVGGFSKREAAEIVEVFFETIKETVARGELVKLAGFGNFSPKDIAQRPGRNPRTGESVPIAPRRVLRFRPSPALVERLNKDA